MEEEEERVVSSGMPSLIVFFTKERQHQEQKQEAKRHGKAIAIHKMSRSKGGGSMFEKFLGFWSFIFYLTLEIRD